MQTIWLFPPTFFFFFSYQKLFGNEEKGNHQCMYVCLGRWARGGGGGAGANGSQSRCQHSGQKPGSRGPVTEGTTSPEHHKGAESASSKGQGGLKDPSGTLGLSERRPDCIWATLPKRNPSAAGSLCAGVGGCRRRLHCHQLHLGSGRDGPAAAKGVTRLVGWIPRKHRFSK